MTSTSTTVAAHPVAAPARLPAGAAPAPDGLSRQGQPWALRPAEEVVQAVRDLGRVLPGKYPPDLPARGARAILDHLAALPGESWQDRWSLFDAQTADGGDWKAAAAGPGYTFQTEWMLRAGLECLVLIGVVRPSYAWQRHHSRIRYFKLLPGFRDPDLAPAVEARLALHRRPQTIRDITCRLTQLLAHTGKSLRDLDGDDLVAMDAALAELPLHSRYRRAVEHLWRDLTDLGLINPETRAWPGDRVRKPQFETEELVDRCDIRDPHREVLVEYLKRRRPSMDYNSFRNLVQKVVKNFWSDVTAHHPDLTTFALTREQAAAWKERIRTKPNGQPRVNYHSDLFTVRAFYLDMAQWALEDSFWVPWATSPPVSRAEVSGWGKAQRSQVARIQQRTRQLAPVLPRLVAQAEQDRRDTAHRLEQATAAGHGGVLQVDGQDWTVRHRTSTSKVRIHRDGRVRDLDSEADEGFWTWAAVETLRLTGIRSEELQELTHFSLMPYRLPATGEEIPLLHIVPSKTDEERLLVAGPELVNVLASVIHRVRDGKADVPLTQRFDPGMRELSLPLPHLFCRKYGNELRPIPGGTLSHMLHRLAARADIQVNGQPVSFTSHDFRRVFATDALASGLPTHIVQVLLGHKSIATTQIYAAIYPEDVIRHHRTWIGQRRLHRPSEEYRQPTAAEWEEFEGHFVKRKVSLGTCGRAYGTNCHHEHACVRCALLRPDPTQAARFRDIITNLNERIAEAEQNHWLGELEGLRISLSAAVAKLDSLQELGKQNVNTFFATPAIPPRRTESA